tara:strand:+ start:1592 stop:2692 length:1101 start_codon:yes stop_codon:yes gene_type:complete
MKTYLVGGAVRDKLLGNKPKERDWVVVGSSPDEMKSKGFKQVGKDFPVFLHPITGEEHALARTERKSGHGYKGFEFDVNSNVTLEEDLERRDLTINAIAQDDDGTLIDPFNGQQDIKNKKLRHVSEAFSEDPLRVLRILRFKTNLPGFEIAPETNDKIKEVIKSGELNYLTGERIWLELYKTNNLSKFLQYILDYKISFLFPGLSKIKLKSLVDSTITVSSKELRNKLYSISYIISKFESSIDLLCHKIKAPNEYKELANMIYSQMSNVVTYKIKKSTDPKILLNIVNNLDIRKKERLNSFLNIAKIYFNASDNHIEFFKSLIIQIQCYRLDHQYKSKSGIEIKKIIEKHHIEITQNHIKDYLDNK